MTKKILQQGAEATITLDNNTIIKTRVKKSYRFPDLDEKLRKSRTRSEARIISKLEKSIPVPKVLRTDNKEEIVLEYIKGEKLSESLEKLNYKLVCKKIGESIARIHDTGIIHGDLTTSNMIWKNGEVYFIDFGLAFHSKRIEDKAVDLHLLRQALEAKHFTIWEECFKTILDNYKAKDSEIIKKRIKIVESRGRYKEKY